MAFKKQMSNSRVIICIWGIMLLFLVFNSGVAETAVDLIPEKSIWGISRDNFEDVVWGEFRECKIGNSTGFTLNGIEVNSYTMDSYYVFDEIMWNTDGWTYKGLSKIVYLLSGSNEHSKDELNRCYQELVEQMTETAGTADSSTNAVTRWEKQYFKIEIGKGRFKKYTGSSNLNVAIVFTAIDIEKPDIQKATPKPVDTGEIVFNSIPWDISITEANEIMVSKGFQSYKPKDGSLKTWPYWWTDPGDHSIDEAGLYIGGSQAFSKSKPKIGGHPVDWLYLFAYYDYNENGVNKEPAKSHYCTALIIWEVEDEFVDEIFDDLKTKLIKIHGEPIPSSNNNIVSCEWRGVNNTAVHLEKGTHWGTKVIGLVYGHTDIEKTLTKVKEAVLKSKKQEYKDDYGGL